MNNVGAHKVRPYFAKGEICRERRPRRSTISPRTDLLSINCRGELRSPVSRNVRHSRGIRNNPPVICG